MKRLPKITESFLIKRIKRLIKEEELEEVRITPQQYYDLLKAVYYKAQAIPRLSRFKGKKIVESNLTDQIQCHLKIIIRFSREPDHHIAGNGHMGLHGP